MRNPNARTLPLLVLFLILHRGETGSSVSPAPLHPDYWLFERDLDRVVDGLPPALAQAVRREPRAFLDDYKALLGPGGACLDDVAREGDLGDYRPPDLRPVLISRSPRHDLLMRAEAALSLSALLAAAARDGVALAPVSAFRSRERQAELFGGYLRSSALEAVESFSSRPGFSQHQLGLAADIGDVSEAFAGTASGRWLAANAADYGFSQSYPRDGRFLTGIVWEPWHYCYLGRSACLVQDRWFGGLQPLLLRYHRAHRDFLTRSRFR